MQSGTSDQVDEDDRPVTRVLDRGEKPRPKMPFAGIYKGRKYYSTDLRTLTALILSLSSQ